MADPSWINTYKEQIRYPGNCVSLLDKLEFLYNAEESLRLTHNVKGKDYRDGKIAKVDWLFWKTKFYSPKSNKIAGDLGVAKMKLQLSKRFPVNLDHLEL